MTLRIEKGSSGLREVLCVIGRISSENLNELKAQMKDIRSGMVLDLGQVTVVDVNAVRFLGACAQQGVEFLNCPPYIREWMSRERTGSE